jgi:hypothetical protein
VKATSNCQGTTLNRLVSAERSPVGIPINPD